MGGWRILKNERGIYGSVVLLRRMVSRSTSTFHGWLLGWKGAVVPIGSNIVGSRYIRVESGFFSSGKVWIEAVSNYGEIEFLPSIRIGRNFRASERVHISSIDRIEIGDDCLFGSNIYVADHSHGNYRGARQSLPEESPALRALAPTGAVVIGDRCWIGDNAVILGGVTLGTGAVIAANSVVLSDVPPMTIVAGAPAKAVKSFDVISATWTRTLSRHRS